MPTFAAAQFETMKDLVAFVRSTEGIRIVSIAASSGSDGAWWLFYEVP